MILSKLELSLWTSQVSEIGGWPRMGFRDQRSATCDERGCCHKNWWAVNSFAPERRSLKKVCSPSLGPTSASISAISKIPLLVSASGETKGTGSTRLCSWHVVRD